MARYSSSDKGKDFRVNRAIRATEVRLIDNEGNMIGVVPIEEAVRKAKYAGMDLIEVSPNAKPPVCKIGDYGKLRYEAQKKANLAKKKQKVVSTKEVKMSLNIGEGDYQTKLTKTIKFLEKGHKVKISFRFRGREITHKEIVLERMDDIILKTEEYGKVELGPKMEGRQMVLILIPAETK